MWEEGARIYGTPGVYNNFPPKTILIGWVGFLSYGLG